VFHISPRTPNPIDISMGYLAGVKERFVAEGRTPVPGTVALVGFRDEPARVELVALLAACGVPVAACIIPVASERLMGDALNAGTLVFRGSDMHQPIYDRLFGDVDRPRVTPDAPWGVEATAAWVQAVADAAGRGEAAAEVLRDRLRVLDARRRVLEADAARHGLAFVLDPGQEDRLVGPDSQTGLPVLAAVRAMGFRVRIALYAGRAARFRDGRDRIAASPAAAGVEILGFATRDELHALLDPAAVQAVFSEYFYDHRLSRAGLGQFSAREFEMGFEGALRGQARLVRIAGTPFYREQAAHLARPSADWWDLEAHAT
jgi:hypothetical protein